MTQKNRVVGDVRQIDEKTRLKIVDDGHGPRPQFQELETCRHCNNTEWIPTTHEGFHQPTGWYCQEVAPRHRLSFCPEHRTEGQSLCSLIASEINTLVKNTLEGNQSQRKYTESQIRLYANTKTYNPPGMYSQKTVERMAALPSGKTSQYWSSKKRMFPALAKQQESMNFPDLIEMRGWTILYRHADLIWAEVYSIWEKIADHLQTPYPLSDPRFMANPQAVADAVESRQMDRARPIENFRMTRFHESLTHRGNLPIKWDLTQDLGIDNLGASIVAHQDFHNGLPFIVGTDTIATKAKDHRESLTHEQFITAQLLNTMLDAPPAQFLKLAMLQEVGP